MDFKCFTLFLIYFTTIKSSQEIELEVPASVRRALILNILHELNILHDVPVRKSSFVGRKLNEARTDLSIQRAILDHIKPVHNIQPRFEKLVAPANHGDHKKTPPESLLNAFNTPKQKQRIQPPSFLQPKRKPPLGIGNPNRYVTLPDSVWGYINTDKPKSTFEIQTTTTSPMTRTITSLGMTTLPTTFHNGLPNTQIQQGSGQQGMVPAESNTVPTTKAPKDISVSITTTASPSRLDPMANLFDNLVQNSHSIFDFNNDPSPKTLAVDVPSSTSQTANTETENSQLNDPFVHLLSNFLNIPAVLTSANVDPIPGNGSSITPPGSAASPNPLIASMEPRVNNTDPMTNLFSNLLDQVPTSFGLSNPGLAEQEPTVNKTNTDPMTNVFSNLLDQVPTTFGLNDPGLAEQVSTVNKTSLFSSTIVSTTPSPILTPTTTVNQDTGLNALIPQTSLIIDTSPTQPAVIDYLTNTQQSGSATTHIANSVPTSQIHVHPNLLTIHSDTFQNPSLDNQVPPTVVTSPNRDVVVSQASQPTKPQLTSTNVTKSLIQLFTSPTLSEGRELNDIEKLSSPPTVFTLGFNTKEPSPVGNHGASDVNSQPFNPNSTVPSKPVSTAGINGQMNTIATVLPSTTNLDKAVHPLISETISSIAGSTHPTVVQDKPPTPATTPVPVPRLNTIFNTRPVPRTTTANSPRPSSGTLWNLPAYYFDPVTKQFRRSNQSGASNQARPYSMTYPQPHNPTQTNPQVYHSTQINSQAYKPTQVKPQPYHPTQANPQPYHPNQANPQPYNPTQANPQTYHPTQANPQVYKPTQVKPQPYHPTQANPQPYHPTQANQPYHPTQANHQPHNPTLTNPQVNNPTKANLQPYHPTQANPQQTNQQQGAIINRYPVHHRQQPTLNQYPNINQQQVPAGYRPLGYYAAYNPNITGTVQVTKQPAAALPTEPTEPVEPEEPAEPAEPADPEELTIPRPFWYPAGGSSSSSSSEED